MAWLRRRRLIVPLLLLLSLLLGGGFALSLEKGLPSVHALRDWRPSALTTLYAVDGSVLARIGDEKRIVIEYNQIPKQFINGIVATEDSHFYHHFGVDPLGIARAVVSNVRAMKWGTQGGSTITQQLARNLFLKSEKTMSRKIQEAMLAIQIEREYTKEEILTFYSNQVYLGHGRYGVEAAAEYYFSRHAKDLSLAQCALLAGLVQGPGPLSPIRHPDRALQRRKHVLDRMREEGYVTTSEQTSANAEPLVLLVASEEDAPGRYFTEEVRRYLVQKYGEDALYSGGLSVETTLDLASERAAEGALRAGVLQVERRRGFRSKWRNVSSQGPLDRYRDPAWAAGPPETGRTYPALIVSLSGTSAILRVGSYRASLAPSDVAWTGRTKLSSVMRTGDLVPFRVVKRIDGESRLEGTIPPSPSVEGALVAIDAKSGEIRALVGGFDFQRSEFDRAVQARRQAGSAFKPILFSAAVDKGMTAAQTLFDEPTVLVDPETKQPYQPENYYKRYYGLTTLREALEESRNIVSVVLLDEVGYRPVIDRARSLGISTRLDPYPSMALGAFEVSLLEMTSAYSVFPNQGVRVEPHFIRRVKDRDGNILEESKAEVREIMKPETAFITTWLLKGVTEEGTAAQAKSLGRPLAGKTGTTDDYSDAWFIGSSPSLTCGVWIGTDKKESLGNGETGAVAALPIWIDFFGAVLKGKPVEEFDRPSNVGLVPIDRRTGKRASADTGCEAKDVVLEAFVEGTEPTALCSANDHYRLTLPYYLQRFEIDDKKELVGTPEAIAAVIQADPSASTLSSDGKTLSVTADGTLLSVPLALDSAAGKRLKALLAEPLPVSADGSPVFRGLDGRRATVREIHRE